LADHAQPSIFPEAGRLFSSPDSSPGFQFWKQFLTWQRALNARLAPHWITQPQFSILAVTGWLTRDGRAVSQQKIADLAAMDRMHVSHLVRRLVDQGHLQRERTTSDQRTWMISLTDQGLACLALTLPIVETFDAAFFAKQAQNCSQMADKDPDRDRLGLPRADSPGP